MPIPWKTVGLGLVIARFLPQGQSPLVKHLHSTVYMRMKGGLYELTMAGSALAFTTCYALEPVSGPGKLWIQSSRSVLYHLQMHNDSGQYY